MPSHRKLVEELYRAIGTGDMDTIERLGGDAKFESVSFGETTTVREDSEVLHEAFPDLAFEILSCVEQGNLVVIEGIGRATHQGTLRTSAGDLPATNRRVELRFVDVYEIANGRIQSGRYYIDRMSLFEQLGVGAGAESEEPAAAPH